MKRQDGFGIIQVLVISGIISAITYGVLKSYQDTKKESKSYEFKAETLEFTIQLFKILSDKSACENSFKNKDAVNTPAGTITSINNHLNNMVIDLNTQYGETNVMLESLALEDQPGLGDDVQVNPGTEGHTKLVMIYKPRPGSYYQNRRIGRKIKLWVKADAAGAIESCFSMSSGKDTIWSVANLNDIYYNAGKVGVGIDAALIELDIRGWVQTSNALGDFMALGGDTVDYQIELGSSKTVNFLNVATSKGANLEMGNLKASERLHIVPSTVPCTPSIEGAMRYKLTIQQLQLCEGTYWMDFTP